MINLVRSIPNNDELRWHVVVIDGLQFQPNILNAKRAKSCLFIQTLVSTVMLDENERFDCRYLKNTLEERFRRGVYFIRESSDAEDSTKVGVRRAHQIVGVEDCKHLLELKNYLSESYNCLLPLIVRTFQASVGLDSLWFPWQRRLARRKTLFRQPIAEEPKPATNSTPRAWQPNNYGQTSLWRWAIRKPQALKPCERGWKGGGRENDHFLTLFRIAWSFQVVAKMYLYLVSGKLLESVDRKNINEFS